MNRHDTQTARIPSGGATSAVVGSWGRAAVGVALPPAFTGTALTFSVCPRDPNADGSAGTYQPLYADDGVTLVALPVTQGRSYLLPEALALWPHFKIVSNAAEAANRDLVIVMAA